MVRDKQRRRDADAARDRELLDAALDRAIKAGAAGTGRLINAQDQAGALIRQDLEPLLYKLYKSSFPSINSSNFDWAPHEDDFTVVGSGGRFHVEPPPVTVTTCLKCRIRPHSDYDLFYCDKCRPR